MASELWLNHLAAQKYAATLHDPAARAALRAIHNLLLECTEGGSLNFLRTKMKPSGPLDINVFYNGVAAVFLNWSKSPIRSVELPRIGHGTLNLTEAAQFAESCPSHARTPLMKLIEALQSLSRADCPVDVLFCCRLLFEILRDKNALSDIRSGEAERHAHEVATNEDAWNMLWINPKRDGS